eukprot:s3116_g3.t1
MAARGYLALRLRPSCETQRNNDRNDIFISSPGRNAQIVGCCSALRAFLPRDEINQRRMVRRPDGFCKAPCIDSPWLRLRKQRRPESTSTSTFCGAEGGSEWGSAS